MKRHLFTKAFLNLSVLIKGSSKSCPLCLKVRFGLLGKSSLSLLYSTTLIGEDTDLLVLLLYYAQENGKGIYFKSEKPKNDGSQKVYDIRSLTGRI